MSAKTVDTSATTYMSGAEALKRGQWKTFADLCADEGVRLTKAALLTDDNFLALLRDACGEIESCCLVGGRYRPDDLNALATNAGVGAGKLFRLTYQLMIVFAYQRRPDMEMKQPWIYEQAMADLQALNDGIEIFSFRETEKAGVVNTHVETASDVENRNGLVVQAARLFGRRSNRNDRFP